MTLRLPLSAFVTVMANGLSLQIRPATGELHTPVEPNEISPESCKGKAYSLYAKHSCPSRPIWDAPLFPLREDRTKWISISTGPGATSEITRQIHGNLC